MNALAYIEGLLRSSMARSGRRRSVDLLETLRGILRIKATRAHLADDGHELTAVLLRFEIFCIVRVLRHGSRRPARAHRLPDCLDCMAVLLRRCPTVSA